MKYYVHAQIELKTWEDFSFFRAARFVSCSLFSQWSLLEIQLEKCTMCTRESQSKCSVEQTTRSARASSIFEALLFVSVLYLIEYILLYTLKASRTPRAILIPLYILYILYTCMRVMCCYVIYREESRETSVIVYFCSFVHLKGYEETRSEQQSREQCMC